MTSTDIESKALNLGELLAYLHLNFTPKKCGLAKRLIFIKIASRQKGRRSLGG